MKNNHLFWKLGLLVVSVIFIARGLLQKPDSKPETQPIQEQAADEQRTDDRGQRTEPPALPDDGEPLTEDRGQRTEDGGRKTGIETGPLVLAAEPEPEKQKTDDRGQRTDDSEQKTEPPALSNDGEPELDPEAVAEPESEAVLLPQEPELELDPAPEPMPPAPELEPTPEPPALSNDGEPVFIPPEPEPVVLPPEPEPEPEPVVIPPEPEPEPEPVVIPPEPEPEPEPVVIPPEPEPEPVVIPPEPEPIPPALSNDGEPKLDPKLLAAAIPLTGAAIALKEETPISSTLAEKVEEPVTTNLPPIAAQASIPIIIEKATTRGRIVLLEDSNTDRYVVADVPIAIWHIDEKNKETLLYQTRTNDDGMFSLPELKVGIYRAVMGKTPMLMQVIPAVTKLKEQERAAPKALLILMPKHAI